MNLQKIFRRSWLRYVVAVAIVVAAAALRIWPLQGLELRIPWVTFYPAVMVSGLYGGITAGLLTTTLSVLTVAYWSPTGQPFLKDAGDWLGVGVFTVNCTMISLIAEAMLRAQARARKAQEQAEAANRAKSVFLATMSHELRTPLNAILGFSELMRSDPAIPREQRASLDVINRSGEHLLSLIDGVLDMAKIDAGRVALEVRPFDLGALVQDITDMLRARAEEKGLRLVLDQSSEFPHFVTGDEAKLRQVLINLLGNAIKYTREGGVTLRLKTRPDKEREQLVMEVKDSGVGIAKADQARIFEPFVQVGKPATQKGTGLGLAIVRDYVTMMGGRIAVDSTPGRGSLFRVELPVQRAEAAEITTVELATGQVIGLEPGQPEYRVLIVEDQMENWLLLQRLLKDAGFTVKLAENGAEGVELFQSFQPHFIWMDRRMPVMDGMEATRRIRALEGGRDVKIAAVSASAFAEERAEMLAAGMDDFVRKPYRPAEIFDCMARQLGVRFVYEHAAPAEAETPLSLDGIEDLPADLRRELSDALIRGCMHRLAGIMPSVERHNPALAKAIAGYLRRFDYLPILDRLEGMDRAVT